MPIQELTESDLQAYHDKLSNPALLPAASLSELSILYSKFEVNEHKLINFKYGLDRINMENTYTEEKRQYQNRLNNLKKLYKQVDNRIISVDQKISRGIPEDMALVEKLIAEQESIVQEQEKLNNAEAELAERKSQIDISYGKMREKLEQNQISQTAPLKSKFEAYILKLNAADKQIKTRTNLCATAVIIGFPLLIELIAIKAGMPVLLSKAAHQHAIFHYLFLCVLILTELFLAERIRNIIYSFFALRYAKASYAELLAQLQRNLKNNAALEKKSGMTAQQVLQTII